MAGIVFPDIAGSVLPFIAMERQDEQHRLERERQNRLDERQLRMDELTLQDRKDQRSLHQMQVLQGLDDKQRAKMKEAADWQAYAAHSVLSAPPETRQQVYTTMLGEAQKRGYNVADLPPQYSPALDGQLDFYRRQAHGIAEMLTKQEGDRPQPMGPLGGAPGAPAASGDVMARAGNAISGIESGGKYDALGPMTGGDRAHGKYQIMGANIGPWTQEVFGKPMTPQEFLANPQAQDAVFKAKFGQYVQKYGPEGASRAWFAGEGGMNNPNAADVNGMTVAKYGQQFAQNFGAPQPTIGTPPASMMAQGANAAPMPGPPAGMIPPGPPPAQMPNGPMLAQSGGAPVVPPQGDAVAGQGDVMAPPRAAPADPVLELRTWVHQQFPGAAPYRDKSGNPVVDPHSGLLRIRMANGQDAFVRPPAKPEAPPAGYRPSANGGLEPIPGGPADRDKIPSGYRMVPGGGLEFIPGGPADPAIVKRASPMNNEQARDAGFADRMLQADAVLKSVETQGTDFLERMSGKVPLGVGKYAQTEDYQKFKQAKDNFINAQLRRESGAAISKDEYDKADEQYFPQPGDKPGTIEQKALNRRLALDAMVRGAGPTYQPGPNVPKAPKAPEGGDRESLLFDARKAIQQGAPKDAVMKRLKEMGVEGGL